MNPPRPFSLQDHARLAGFLYLAIIVCAGFSEGYVRGGLVVPGDAVATAANIRNSEFLFRVGFATDLVAFLCDVALALTLYLLLEPVSRAVSLVAAGFRMAQATVLGLNMLHHFAAILLLSGAAYLTVFEPEQLQALALLSLDAHRHGYLISQMFFGVHCLLLGYLLFKASYFPAFLGVLMAVAGVGYLADGFAFFLAPELATTLTPFFITPVIVAELTLCFWLLVKGAGTVQAPAKDSA